MNSRNTPGLPAGIIVVVFGVAGVGKLLSPGAAAEKIGSAWTLTPDAAIALVESVAWLEILTALGLLHRTVKAHALRMTHLMVSFMIAALAWDIAVGNTGSCGCFGALAVLSEVPSRAIIVVTLFASALRIDA